MKNAPGLVGEFVSGRVFRTLTTLAVFDTEELLK